MAIFIWIVFLFGSFALASIIDGYYPGTFKIVMGTIAIAGTAFAWGTIIQEMTSDKTKK